MRKWRICKGKFDDDVFFFSKQQEEEEENVEVSESEHDVENAHVCKIVSSFQVPNRKQ